MIYRGVMFDSGEYIRYEADRVTYYGLEGSEGWTFMLMHQGQVLVTLGFDTREDVLDEIIRREWHVLCPLSGSAENANTNGEYND